MCWRLPETDTNVVFNPVPPRQSDVLTAKTSFTFKIPINYHDTVKAKRLVNC